jgi:hypothetical protein
MKSLEAELRRTFAAGRMRRFISAAACCLAAALAGCGPAGSPFPSAKVSGKVTLDGQPVEKGTINFMPVGGGQARADSDEIAAGAYAIDEAPLGKVRAYIMIPKKTGRMLPGTTSQVEEEINATPPKYLQGIEVEIAGDNDKLDFALISAKGN